MTTDLNNLQSWMGNNPVIGNLRIDELILPGTHNSGFDKKSPTGGNKWENTQDVSPAEQMAGGIRVLDLRVQFMPGEAADSPKRFSIFHSSRNGRTIAVDILGPLNNFYAAQPNAREIIILDFHEFKDFTVEAHLELEQLLRDKIGDRLIPASLVLLTVSNLWEQHPGKTVVLAYNHATSGDMFWPGVSQKWSGDNLNNTTKLKKFMDGIAALSKPERELWSIQCAKYTLPFHVPDDFSDKVDSWFKSQDINSYIQKFYIINTDWSLRSAIVKNCIHASTLKAEAKLATV